MKLTKLHSPTPGNDENNRIHHEPETEEVTELQDNIEPVKVEHFNDQPPNQDYQLTRDRARRQTRPNPRYESLSFNEFALVSGEALDQIEPATYEEAMNGNYSENWINAMQEEMKSLSDYKT